MSIKRGKGQFQKKSKNNEYLETYKNWSRKYTETEKLNNEIRNLYEYHKNENNIAKINRQKVKELVKVYETYTNTIDERNRLISVLMKKMIKFNNPKERKGQIVGGVPAPSIPALGIRRAYFRRK